jgi:anthranilate phosphoribosyltransferase
MMEQIKYLREGQTLCEEDMMLVMRQIMNGRISEERVLEFLEAFSMHEETVEEITAAAKVLREGVIKIKAPYNAVDCCGTGGDQAGTYNISTAVALVAASCGVPVAKHGNRAASSKTGAADVLEALGVNLDLPPEALEDALIKFNFAFLMAPNLHKGMKYVSSARKKIGKRTIFNLLGPLANPAGTRRQLIGVFDRKWMIPMAQTLKNLGTKKAWIVCGADGLDEISTTGPTYMVSLDEEGNITERTLFPEMFGVSPSKIEKILGGGPEENAAALRAVLEGRKCPYRDIVVANASAVLNIHGSASSLIEGAQKAEHAIDSGETLQTLKDYIAFSRSPA